MHSLAYWARFLAVGSARFLVSCAKNCVKILIGRQTYFDPCVVFFKLYVKQLIARRPIRKITCDGFTGEGAGSQALMIMSAISFARACGLTYLHTPFKTIAHADRPMREWVTAWENHFNLGDGELTVSGEDRDAVNFAYNFTDLIRCFGVSDPNEMFRHMLPEFRRKYYKNKAPRLKDVPTIGVHIRRGDVSENHPAWTSTEAVLKTTSQARSILQARGMSCRVRVFSEGKEVDFSPFRRLGAELLLNVDAVWTMQELVESDVLIMAKSCFSFVAAMFCNGIKIYEPCGYVPLSDWVVCEPNGEFETRQFESQLGRPDRIELLGRSSRLGKHQDLVLTLREQPGATSPDEVV